MKNYRRQNSFQLDRRTALGLVFLLGIPSLIFFLEYRQVHQPALEGKTLIAWALELNGPGPTGPAESIFREAGPEAAPILIKALRKRDPVLKKPLLFLAPKLPNFLGVGLSRWVRPDEVARTRIGAARALELLGTNAHPAIPALGRALCAEDKNLSYRAAMALVANAKEAVPQFTAALRDSKQHVRFISSYGLTRLGPIAASAVPALIERFGDRDPQVRKQAAEALGAIGREAVEPLVKCLNHPAPTYRVFAMDALRQMGPLAREAIAPLLSTLHDEDPSIRQSAIAALGAIHPRSESVIGAAISVLRDKNPSVRSRAAEALLRGAPATKTAVPALVITLNDPEGEVRAAAAAALGAMGGDASSAVPALTEMLGDRNPLVVRSAREALERIRGRPEVSR